MDAGTAVWNSAGSAFRFTDGGVTTALFEDDGLNVISWANGLPAGVIAWAQSHVSGGIVTQCDIQFSNAFAWGDGAPGSNTMDIQTIGMHEVGHWLRLLDQYMDGDSSKVMYGIGDENEQKRTLTAADIAGIRWIYPGVGTSPTPTPTPTPTPAPTVTPKVTLTLSGLRSGVLRLGRRVTAKGTVTPTSLAGSKVALTLQKKKGARWVKVQMAAATIGATSAYSWKYKATRTGSYRVRAAIPRTAEHAAASTTWRSFRVR